MMLRAILVAFTYLGIRDINKCYKIDNASTMDDFYRDHFSPKKEDEITVISLNINSLRTEGWKVKNDLVRDFTLGLDANIVTMQEININ
jgi:hypothetical protein